MALPSPEGATASGGINKWVKGMMGEQRSYRDWSGLPEPALLSIATSLTGSLADVLAFGRVCRAWRSVASANDKDLMSSLPPFLFLDRDADFYCPADGRRYKNRRLTALLREEGPSETLGCSFGHLLIFHNRDGDADYKVFSVVNPLTGARLCTLPPNRHDLMRWAALSSPPASKDCVFWAFDDDFIGFCCLEDQKWTTFWPRAYYRTPPVFLHDKAYIDRRGKLEAFDINPPSSYSLPIVPVGGSSSLAKFLHLRLCVSGAELLLVAHVQSPITYREKRFLVCRFDFSLAKWVRIRSLGDRALFWDTFNVTVSENPNRWGGYKNCIYYFDKKDCTLRVFHLKESKRECLARGSSSIPRFSTTNAVWIHPSLCH